MKKTKLFLSVFVGLIAGLFGINKDGYSKEISLTNHTNKPINEGAKAEVCSENKADKDSSLFVSCSGFLE